MLYMPLQKRNNLQVRTVPLWTDKNAHYYILFHCKSLEVIILVASKDLFGILQSIIFSYITQV